MQQINYEEDIILFHFIMLPYFTIQQQNNEFLF